MQNYADRAEIRASLLLSKVAGVGRARFKKLVNIFGTARDVLGKNRAALEQVVPPDTARNIEKRVLKSDLTIDDELALIKEKGAGVLPFSAKRYPKLLKEINSPPSNIYFYGDFQESDEKAIGVVGTRAVSEYGKYATRKLTRELVAQGFTVVSGFASGVDTIAHREALKAGGRTLAVFAGGIDYIYPATNKALYRKVQQSGAIVSEIPLLTEPDPHSFPQRNRIIAGLSLGTVVVEAPERSGALITASYALEQNREVFAVPGNINSPKSRGTNKLIQAGAKLACDAEDIISEFPFELISVARKDNIEREMAKLSTVERKLYNTIDFSPQHIDEITKKVDMGVSQALSHLLTLELKGLVKQLPGKSFIKL